MPREYDHEEIEYIASNSLNPEELRAALKQLIVYYDQLIEAVSSTQDDTYVEGILLEDALFEFNAGNNQEFAELSDKYLTHLDEGKFYST